MLTKSVCLLMAVSTISAMKLNDVADNQLAQVDAERYYSNGNNYHNDGYNRGTTSSGSKGCKTRSVIIHEKDCHDDHYYNDHNSGHGVSSGGYNNGQDCCGGCGGGCGGYGYQPWHGYRGYHRRGYGGYGGGYYPRDHYYGGYRGGYYPRSYGGYGGYGDYYGGYGDYGYGGYGRCGRRDYGRCGRPIDDCDCNACESRCGGCY